VVNGWLDETLGPPRRRAAPGPFIFRSARSLEGCLKNKNGQEGQEGAKRLSKLFALLALLCRKTAPAIRPSTRMN
jgi:hypothetical protein